MSTATTPRVSTSDLKEASFRGFDVVTDNVDITLGAYVAKNATVLFNSAANMLIAIEPNGEQNTLSVKLLSDGYLAMPGEAFIKDWSEGSGCAQSLVDAGAGEIIEIVFVGPFRSPAARFRVTA